MAKHKWEAVKSNPIVDPWKWAQEHLSPSDFNQLSATLQKDLKSSIRINRLKAIPQTVIEKWAHAYQWFYSQIPFCSSGYAIAEKSTSTSRTIEHLLGYYYIQESASMLPAELFNLDKLDYPLILDMAASPGGKTTHLADRTQDKGLIIANDVSRSRISALRIVLQNWGAINQAITLMQGERLGQLYPDTFDAVLLDAPCSMQGLRATPSHRMRPITENEIQSLAERQFRLLESALQTVKTGGQVVYATCTLSPDENEGVISRILNKYPKEVEIDDIQDRLPTPAPAIPYIKARQLPEQIKKAARLWPHIFGTAGFFCAKLIKKGGIHSAKHMDTSGKKPTLKGSFINERDSYHLTDMISSLYGFDLSNVVETQSLEYWQYKEDIYLVPSQLAVQFPSLPIHSKGMFVGKYVSKGWQPSHEFVSRFGDLFTDSIYILEDEHYDAWIKGEDIRGINGLEGLRKKILAIRDASGRNLGRGKMLTNRLKNMLPTRLF